jgi:GT2 family glycosyltransferase
MTLTWGLVVATKDRLDPLRHCVRYALAQTRPPAEVIIVDASAGWEDHRDAIATLLADRSDVRLVYEPAPQPSSAVQRNVGIDAARADILFMIDDDSFLYPDAAAEVMRLYEADTGGEVAGIQMRPAPHPPDAAAVRAGTQQERRGIETVAPRSGLRQRLLRAILAYGPENSFVPYEDGYPDRPVPPALAAFDVRPARLFEGYRMTLRRDVVTRLRFEPLLLYYCPGEDLDLSYRASRVGAILTARAALVHHFASDGGRLNRRQVETLGTLNQALFLRRNAPDQLRARARFTRWALHKAAAGLLVDVARGRADLPKLRGCLQGLRLARQVFGTAPEELERRYPALQERIVKG